MDNTKQTPDDALEQRDDGMFHPTQDEPKLAEDNDPPAAPADDQPHGIPKDHPATDAELDSQELIDAGLTTASGVDAQHGKDENHNQPRPLDGADES